MTRDNPWRKHGLSRNGHRTHNVLVEDPHPQSYAAQIMLREKLTKEAVKAGDEWSFYFWMKFRNKYLIYMKHKMGGLLICQYCGKKRLKKETKQISQLATVDHFVPVSKGGAMFEESNLRVACHPCNRIKGNTLPEEIVCTLI